MDFTAHLASGKLPQSSAGRGEITSWASWQDVAKIWVCQGSTLWVTENSRRCGSHKPSFGLQVTSNGSPAQNSRGICTCKGAARTAADGLFIRLMCQHDSNFGLDFMYWPIPSGKERGTGHKCDWMLLLHDAKEEQLLGLVHHFILWASFLPASSQNNSRKIIILLMVQENEHKRDGERCLKSLL